MMSPLGIQAGYPFLHNKVRRENLQTPNLLKVIVLFFMA